MKSWEIRRSKTRSKMLDGFHRMVLDFEGKKYYFTFNEHYYSYRNGSIVENKKFPIDQARIVQAVESYLQKERGRFSMSSFGKDEQYLSGALENAIQAFHIGAVDQVVFNGKILMSRDD